MAWLRIDDGFTKHPKFEGWTKAARWDWLECMEYCARYRTRGRIPSDLSLLPRAVTPALLKRAEESGWAYRGDDGALWINDWEAFNPVRQEAVEAAVRTTLEAYPEASANDLFKLIGGNRKQVLELIRRYRNGTQNGTGTSTTEPVPELVIRARSRPVPSKEPSTRAVTALRPDDPDRIPEDAGPPDDEQPSDYAYPIDLLRSSP